MGSRLISVGEFMTTKLVTVHPSDDVDLADSLFRLAAVRHLPVVEEGRLVGLVTHSDFLRHGETSQAKTKDRKISEIMTREVTTVRPTTGLARAAKLLLERKFGCLPVCDDAGALVGIVTEADFVRFAAEVVEDLDLVSHAVRPL